MKTLSMLALGTVLLGASLSAFAHHGFAVEYDRSKQLTLVGKLTHGRFREPSRVALHRCQGLARQDSELGAWSFPAPPCFGETVLIRASTRP